MNFLNTLPLLICTFFLCTPLTASKTQWMFYHLDQGMLCAYNKHDRTLSHNRVCYQVLQGNIPYVANKPFVSISSYPLSRPIIALDPAHSPKLQTLFAELLLFLQGAQSIEEVLKRTSYFVHTVAFNPFLSSVEQLDSFVQHWIVSKENFSEHFAQTKKGQYCPVIPLDDFLEERIGVCCHHALTVAYLIARLIDETSWLPNGQVFYVRDLIRLPNSTVGGHAWNLYVPEQEDDAWHIDSMWNLVKKKFVSKKS